MQKKSNNQIRIIAGDWRGRKINFEDAEGLRPTGDRVRETLFNWLAPYIDSAHCLDLFTGSGALGIEALSRGALSVTFVDINDKTIQQIGKELEKLSAENFHLYKMSAVNFIHSQKFPETGFNIIFLDPPYSLDIFQQCIDSLEQAFQNSTQTPDQVLIYYEHNHALDEALLPENWLITKQKKAGQVYFYLLFRKPKINLAN